MFDFQKFNFWLDTCVGNNVGNGKENFTCMRFFNNRSTWVSSRLSWLINKIGVSVCYIEITAI